MRARPSSVLWMALGCGMAGPMSALAGGLQQPEVQLETTTVVGSAAAAAATSEAASQGYVPRAQLENRPCCAPANCSKPSPA